MSWTVQVEQVSEITNKFALAERISGHANAPEEALQCIFTGIMQSLEEMSITKFENSMKDRVWSSVSGEKLKTLKEVFILEFCEKILGGFSDIEAGKMLEEHKRLGAIKNVLYVPRLQFAIEFEKESIINAVVKKASSMTDEWVPEIVDALKKEGVKLPDPK